MKNKLIILSILITLISCNNTECIIEGTVNNSNLNGKRIFLVPVYYEDSLGVDSVVITDNKFKFTRKQEFLADIRVDYHYRKGTENLLVITEPGKIKVVIDSISCGRGTPQNDSLQFWKELLMKRAVDANKYHNEWKNYMNKGDSLNAEISKNNMKIVNDQFVKRSKKLIENLKSGTLYDFLVQRFPKDK